MTCIYACLFSKTFQGLGKKNKKIRFTNFQGFQGPVGTLLLIAVPNPTEGPFSATYCMTTT